MKEEYLRKRQIANNDYQKYAKKSIMVGTFRLISFLLFIVLLVTFLIFKITLLLIISIIAIASFIALIFIHTIIDNKKAYYFNYMKVIDEYIERIDGTWLDRRGETGLQFYQENDDFMKDLNIIGHNSLFSYLCICKTRLGKRKLYKALNNQETTQEELKATQDAIVELKDNVDFCLDFQAKGKRILDNISLGSLNGPTINRYLLAHLIIGLLLTLTTIIAFVISFYNKTFIVLSIGLIIIQFINYFIFSKKHNDILDEIDGALATCEKMYETLVIFANYHFKSSKMQKITEDINKAKIGLQKMNTLIGFDTIRKNIFLFLIFNFLFPFSLMIFYLFNKNHEKYYKTISEGINAFSDLELLVSLAIIGQVKAEISLLEYHNDIKIETINVRHPLLTEFECVPNDFTTQQNINVITGSNMGGKTFFMRTIALNLILGNAGTYTTSTKFISNYYKIFTSMQVVDDPTKGISTFYAELLRIKKAIDYEKTNKPMISFIDEVFKGTNSNDRIEGAIALIKQLNTPTSIVIITSHDFELCNLNIDNLVNYNFSEYYEGNKIKFDYKIKNGRCLTTNAKFLMRAIGIIDKND